MGLQLSSTVEYYNINVISSFLLLRGQGGHGGFMDPNNDHLQWITQSQAEY